MTKAAIRAEVAAWRKQRDVAWLASRSQRIRDAIEALPELHAARVVNSYLSLRGEPDLRPLLRLWTAQNLVVGTPGPRDESPRAVSFPDGATLDEGPIDLMFVPAVAVDGAGARLGRGGGWYDRWLAAHPETVVAAVVFDDQLRAALPTEPHDRPVHLTVTESRVIRHGRPISVVAGVWWKDGRLFAARRRPDGAEGGRWELPGGKVEAHESPADALVREWREELSIDIQVVREGPRVTITRPRVVLNLSVFAVTSSQDPLLGPDHDAFAWLAPGELDALDWAPADRALVPQLPRE